MHLGTGAVESQENCPRHVLPRLLHHSRMVAAIRAKPATKSTLSKLFPASAGIKHTYLAGFQSHIKQTRLFWDEHSCIAAAAAPCNCNKQAFFHSLKPLSQLGCWFITGLDAICPQPRCLARKGLWHVIGNAAFTAYFSEHCQAPQRCWSVMQNLKGLLMFSYQIS